MSDQPDQMILKIETTVLLETDEPILASHCLNQLNAQKWEWLDIRLAGKPGAFQVTCRFAGVGEPQPGPKAAYDASVTRAKAFCKGFISGWHSRKA